MVDMDSPFGTGFPTCAVPDACVSSLEVKLGVTLEQGERRWCLGKSRSVGKAFSFFGPRDGNRSVSKIALLRVILTMTFQSDTFSGMY